MTDPVLETAAAQPLAPGVAAADVAVLLRLRDYPRDSAGRPVLPENFWPDARATRPHLFAKPVKSAMEMTDAEYKAARRQLIIDATLAPRRAQEAAAMRRLEKKYGKKES